MRTVTTFLAAVLMLLPLPAHAVDAVDGFDMPGGDYSNFPAGSAFVCRNTCGGESRCQGWTWVKPGILGPTAHCWLKHALPSLVKNDCCISGSRDDISARDQELRDGLVGELQIYVRRRTALLVLDIRSTRRQRAARPLLAERRRRPSHREPEYGRRREVQNTHGLKP